MLEQFNATIDKLYAAAADRRRWDDALTAVEELTNSAGAVVHIVAREGPGGITSLLGISGRDHFPANHVEEWARDYAPICPRLAAASRWPDARYVCDAMILSEAEMDRCPVYHWYETHGLRYFIGSPLYKNDRVQVVWSLQRSAAQGHVQKADIELFELLKPHVGRALALADQLGTLRSFDQFSSAVLDSLPHAVFALGSDGRLLFANAAASRFLDRGDGILTVDGHLRTRSPLEQARLDALINQALTSGAQQRQSWTLASRVGGGRPYAIFVSPLHGLDEDLLASAAKVLVVVHDPGGRRQVDADMLRSVYGLTEAEAHLASALSGGHSLESAAALLHVRTSTARTHLKAVFRKVGVNRQQDLMRMLASLSTGHLPGR